MLVCLFQFYLQLEESLAILMDPIFPDEQMEPAVKPALMSSTLAAWGHSWDRRGGAFRYYPADPTYSL